MTPDEFGTKNPQAYNASALSILALTTCEYNQDGKGETYNVSKAWVRFFILGVNPQHPDDYRIYRANLHTISEEECNSGSDAGRNRYYHICTQ